MSTVKVTNIQHGSATNVAMVLDSAGTVKAYSTIGVGNTTPAASGAGITFPATASASSDANTLDDYEEGTYTVTMTPSASGSITLNSGADLLSYTKIGRMVTVTGYTTVTSVSSPTGAYVSLSLPFAVASGSESAFEGAANITANILGSSKTGDIAVGILIAGESAARFYDGSVNSIGTGSFATYIQANSDFRFQVTYFTT